MNGRLLTALIAVAVLMFGRPALAQDQVKPVEPSELLKNPKNYWARGIAFVDELKSGPTRYRLGLDGKYYTAFTTKSAGTCYIVRELVPDMMKLELNRIYLFSGTVLNHGDRYYVIVNALAKAADTNQLASQLGALSAAATASNIAGMISEALTDIMHSAQIGQFAYSKQQNLELWQLFSTPGSDPYARALDIVRAAVHNEEIKQKTTGAEILAQYVFQTLAANSPAPALAESAPVESVAETPAAIEGAKNASEVVPSGKSVIPLAPPAKNKISWWQRWKLERQKRTALKAEQKAAKPRANKNADSEIVPSGKKIAPPEPPPQKKMSWWQQWKLDRQKRAALKAEERAALKLEREASKNPAMRAEPAPAQPTDRRAPAQIEKSTDDSDSPVYH